MTYVMSDIHGDSKSFFALLDKINFCDKDTLYILGDVCDRGPDPMSVYIKAMESENIILLKGNHEQMAIGCLSSITDETNLDNMTDFVLWLENGGETTVNSFLELDTQKRNEVFEYMLTLPLAKNVTVGDKTYVLAHAGLSNFSESKALESYTEDEVLWKRPDFNAKLWQDTNKKLVVGHTPTFLIENNIKPCIYHGNGSIIDIDCGAGFPEYGGRLSAFCLETMKEYYL